MAKIVLYLSVIFSLVWMANSETKSSISPKNRSIEKNMKENKISKKPFSKQKLMFPIQGKSLEDVISGYGDPRGGGTRIHEGIDVPADKGTPVIAVADGVVTKVANKGSGGKQIWLQVGAKQFFYAHLDSWIVKMGQEVRQGEIMGTVGNTGNASKTLPHLHLGVYIGRWKTTNPAKLFE